MAFDSDPLGAVFAARRTLAPAAVGSQVLLMSVVSIATIILFNFLRPKNKIIYEPKIKYHIGDKPPPKISDGLFGWLPPVLHTKEPELVEKIGLDAVAFLRFLRLLRWLFTGITLLTCGILIPINVLYNLENVKPGKRDVLSMLTIRDVKGNKLYAHVAVSYLITILVVVLVYIHWREMVRLRHEWYRSPEYSQAFYARTLSIMNVPKEHQSDDGLKTILDSVKMPYLPTSVHIGRKVGKLPEMIEYHNQTVRELEGVLVKYLKDGRIAKRRPTIKIGGVCGLGGVKKDAIDYYTAKLKQTEAAVEDYRAKIDSRKAESYGFASMAAVPYAHIVAKKLARKHKKGIDIALAPNPKDIIWTNMNKSDAAIARKKMIGFWWLAVVCFLSLIPLFLVAILANLDAVTATGYLPFLERWSNDNPTSFYIISGVAPPVVSGLSTFFLPKIMRWLSQYMGALTQAKLDRALVARFFAFLVISQLIIFTLIGVAFNSVTEVVVLIGRHANAHKIISSLNKLPDTINRTYINQASYWLTYFPLRGFLVIFDLAQILNLVWIYFKTRIFGRTPRDIREWTQPPEFLYAIYYSNLLYLGAIGMLFAPLAPLVALAAAVVFWMSSWAYKYQLMFVFITKVETGGRLWNVVINRLLFCVILMQALMVLTIGLQYKFKSLQWISTIPPILVILLFKIYITRKFDRNFRYHLPTEEELKLAKVHSERADVKGQRLEHRFGHPALHVELFTPMLHAKMMPLLSQVYKGKISEDKAKLNEYGGANLDAQVVEGIKIAAIEQNDLEYDPVLYQRDRGELDWDTRSMASTAILDGNLSPSLHSRSQYYNGVPYRSDYERYLASGPNSPQNDIPITSPIDMLTDQRQLLATNYNQQPGYFEQQPQHASVYSDALTSPLSMNQDGASSVRESYVQAPPGAQPPSSQVQSWYSDQSRSLSPNQQYVPQQYPPHQYPPQEYPQPQHYQQPPPEHYPQSPQEQQLQQYIQPSELQYQQTSQLHQGENTAPPGPTGPHPG